MAEAAGLAIGTFALVGAFKDCIDLFSYISVARDIGRDYEIAAAKLDIEKTILFQWAEDVKLLHPGTDPRLDRPAVQSAIGSALASIKLLLGESQALREKYGLVQTKEDEASLIVPSISRHRLDRFIRDFEALSMKIKCQSDQVSIPKRLRWAIKDKDKFDDLIRELSYFIAQLHRIVPCREHSLVELASEDAKRVLTVENLKLLLDASNEMRSPNSSDEQQERFLWEAAEAETDLRNKDAKKRTDAGNRILNRLWFRKMHDRQENVAPAHYKTLRWVLSPPRGELKWDNLADWLQNGTGIYWVSGKAASGKSTLMKLLSQEKRAEDLLSKWAKPYDLNMGSFFFWYAGTKEQKNLDGLWRALLYQILDLHRDLIPYLLPDMWREAYDCHASLEEIQLPSPAEMKMAFHKLATIGSLNSKFCFLIDGLDEFTGDYRVGLDFLKALTTSPRIKVVVSSRPVIECSEALSQYPKLYLQLLTKDDICTYAHDTLLNHQHCSNIIDGNSSLAHMILEKLVSKASGVFLWVVLACKSVCEGFSASDSASELEQRIEELPPELEDLFGRMLSQIPTRYRQRTSRLFKMACRCGGDGAMMTYMRVLPLALMEQSNHDVSKVPIMMTRYDMDLIALCGAFFRRLSVMSQGLLERHGPILQNDSDPRIFGQSVRFLHRTVRDFLETPEFRSMTKQLFPEDDFDTHLAIAKLNLWSASLASEYNFSSAYENLDYIHRALYEVKCAGPSHFEEQVTLLCRVEQMLLLSNDRSISNKYRTWASGRWVHNQPSGYVLLILALTKGYRDLIPLLEKHLCMKAADITDPYPALYLLVMEHGFEYDNGSDAEDLSRILNTFKYLVSSGCSAKHKFTDENGHEETLWDHVVYRYKAPQYRDSKIQARMIMHVLMTLPNVASRREIGLMKRFLPCGNARTSANPRGSNKTEIKFQAFIRDCELRLNGNGEMTCDSEEADSTAGSYSRGTKRERMMNEEHGGDNGDITSGKKARFSSP